MKQRNMKDYGIVLCIVCSAFISLQAQGITEWGENTDPFDPPKTGWIADSLFMGATFLRDTTLDSFVIWLHRNEAGCTGNLYLMVPGGGPFDGWDTLYLFQNHDPAGTRVNLTEDPRVAGYIEHLDTLFFMYRVVAGQASCSRNFRYTGPNRAPGDSCTQADTLGDCQNVDRFWSEDYADDLVSAPDGREYPIGRRWCVAGWIRDHVNNERTDTVEFGFEDLTPGDADFDDIVFHVTGVFLIKPAIITDIQIDAEPDTGTILAGDSITYTATVIVDSVDSFGVHHTVEDTVRAQQVTWEILGDTSGGTLVYGEGPARVNTFTATRAYRSYTIRATIVDGSDIVTTEVVVNVEPDAAYQLVLEGAPDVAGGLSLILPKPIDTLRLDSASSMDTVYGILRDEFGNYTGNCSNADWRIIAPGESFVTAADGGRTNIGEGIITKVGPPGNAEVWGIDMDNPSDVDFRDTMTVVVDPAAYDSLRFVFGTGGQKKIQGTDFDSVVINLGLDTLVRAEGRRTDRVGGDDNDGWVALNVDWSVTSNIDTSNTAPSSANQWDFAPTDTGHGTVTISYRSFSQELPIVVRPGAPAKMSLYAQEGTPDTLGNDPYFGPVAYTYYWPAGRPMPLVGKIFDRFSTWLATYETTPELSQRITWNAVYTSSGAPIAPAVGTFTTQTGHITTFNPRRAFETIDLIATYTKDLTIFRDTVRVYIDHGSADHMVIEASPDSTVSPNADNPVDVLTLLADEIDRDLYAILRDSLGNFVGYADSSEWTSRNTLVVTAAMGTQDSLGEGTITRQADTTKSTWVVARKGAYNDSVQVNVASISYTALRLVVNNNGLRDIDTLVMGGDEDTTLLALGQRSDNGAWEYVDVSWSKSAGLSTAPDPPAGFEDRWSFEPADTGRGTVTIQKAGSSDTVYCIFTAGGPATMALYNNEGRPDAPGTEPYDPVTVIDTIAAGTSINLVAKMFDNEGVWLGDFERAGAPISWSLIELTGTPLNDTLTSLTGHMTSFMPNDAYTIVEISATYDSAGLQISDAARFYVKPGPVTHLVIEASPDPALSPREDNPLNNLTIGSGDTIAYAYAILRDEFGNYVQASPSTEWLSQATDIVTAGEGVAANGEGRMVRMADSGSAEVIAYNRNNNSLRDTFTVNLSNINYTGIQIVVNDNGLKPLQGDTLVLRTDQDTTLYAIGRRSDNGEWDNITVRWSSSGISVTPSAPASADQWSLQPADTGSGRIIISKTGVSGTVYDTVHVVFAHGLPSRLILFPSTGEPYVDQNVPYPSSDSLTAGESLPLVAKVFDHRDVWLDEYEVGAAPVSWDTLELSGQPPTGTLTPLSGYMSMFTPVRARNSLYISAEFNDLGITLRDSIRLGIRAGDAHHLVIEPTPDPNVSPNQDNPIHEVTLTSWDTVSSVYGILRDSLGNYVAPSTEIDWESLDTATVWAADGITEFGEGIIIRRQDEGETRVIAWTADSSLSDTIDVVLNDIVYTALRIVVNSQGLKDLDTLIIRTDEDTTLFALGLRSDNGQWDNVRVAWNAGTLPVSPAAPGSDDGWTFSPDNVDTGNITISVQDTAGDPVTDQLTAIFTPGLPDKLVLYPAEDIPGTNNNVPYPPRTSIDTIAAGDSLQLVAMLFDHQDWWLSQYNNASSPVQWSIARLQGTAASSVLSPRTGNASMFKPVDAFSRVYLIATYDVDGRYRADTVQAYVKAGDVHHLVLEASADRNMSPNDDNPAGTIVIDTSDTISNVYAILRDQYGNWVDYSKSTQWRTPLTGDILVKAVAGNVNLGEGRIIRASDFGGNTGVEAAWGPDTTLKDTVTVILSTISYTKMRIVVDSSGTFVEIDTLSIGTDDDTTLFVQGKRSDNDQWEFVPGTWSLARNLATDPAPPAGRESWEFSPDTVGNDSIIVSFGNAVPDTIPVAFTIGKVSRLVLADNMPSPATQPYPPVSSPVEMTAGDSLVLYANILDHQGEWFSEYATDTAQISWRLRNVTGGTLTDSLSTDTGYKNTFVPEQAYKTVLIIAEFTEGVTTVSDSVQVNILPGAAHHLVLEGDANWQFSPNSDNAIDTVMLNTIDTIAQIYAIIRDEHGNFVAYSRRTDWESRDTGIVEIADGIETIGEGIIHRTTATDDDTTRVAGTSLDYPSLQLTDSTVVVYLNIYFEALRIVTGEGATLDTTLDTLHITTNDDATLRVQGRRSDNGQWVDISARWLMQEDLVVDPSPPARAGSWTFSPVEFDTSGAGWIAVTLDNDTTTPDSVWVIFEPGPVTEIEFEVLTPPEERIAGDTLLAVVRMRNENGLYPGMYCDTMVYQDIIGAGDALDGVVITGADTTLLNERPGDSNTTYQCFDEGIDTLKIVLYNAPFEPRKSDSLHQLYIVANDSVEGYTKPIELLPADLNKIVVEYDDGTPFGSDTVVLESKDGEYLLVFPVGYDRYGNKIGNVVTDWGLYECDTCTNTLHEIDIRADRITRFYYSSEGVLYDESGCIRIVASDSAEIDTFICLKIMAPPAGLVEAATFDMNGNGYLDQVRVHFTKLVTFPQDYSLDNILVTHDKTLVIVVDSIGGGTGVTDSVFTLYLHEDTSLEEPQTDWSLRLLMTGIQSADSIITGMTIDSAGPVIWEIVKVITVVGDNSKDVVTVTFTENLRGGNGSSFSITNPPELVFNVWARSDTGFVRQRHMLDDIDQFLTFRDNNVLRFVMSNGKDLNADHYMNIILYTDSSNANYQLVDATAWGNLPVPDNQKVQVYVQPARPERMDVGPNPASPALHEDLSIAYDREAVTTVYEQNSGTVLAFPIIQAPGANDIINGSMKIYDMVGNLVAQSEKLDMLREVPADKKDGGIFNYYIYWSGTNDKGMKVAPGVYRAVMELDYANSNVKDKQYVSTIGIRR
ncbi:MAG: hypothetical protein GF350_04755 [Chitinivibrionales bacterium]|nr:hypothetical protein [Chitinivibrionales bacterium]